MWLSAPRSNTVALASTYFVRLWAKSDSPSLTQIVSNGSV